MEFINEQIDQYCRTYTSEELEALNKLSRETHLKVMSPRMLSGHLQGSFLSLISKIHQPTHILEIGTYTGYSAICLAQGLKENGKLITIDVNNETEVMANRYFKEAGMENKIELKIGDAREIIPTLNTTFDMVFIDADKKNYSLYFDLIIDKLQAGGLIIADNVLWSGKVLMDESEMDDDTKALHQFNKKVMEDKRVEKMLLPLRDGLMLIRKKNYD